MPVTSRVSSSSRPAARPAPRGVRPMPTRPMPHAAHPAARPSKSVSPVAIGLASAVGLCAAIGTIWFFGTGRTLFVPDVAPAAPAKIEATGHPPTNFYRSTRDGRVIVMEIDQNGTKIKGTISRRDVPIDADEYRDGPVNGNGGPGSPENRVHALGSAFR